VLLDANHHIVAMNQVAHRVSAMSAAIPSTRRASVAPRRAGRSSNCCCVGSGDQRVRRISADDDDDQHPDRVLLIKWRVCLRDAPPFNVHDVYDSLISHGGHVRGRESRPKQLVKIPVLLLNRVVLLSMSDVVHMRAMDTTHASSPSIRIFL